MTNNFEQEPGLTLPHWEGGEIVTAQGIAAWLAEAKEEGATHMIVVCDTWDYSDYPVNVMPDEDVREVEARYDAKNMQEVMEVYWLGGNLDEQLKKHRSFTYGPEAP